MFGVIMVKNMTTIKDLQEWFSMEDVLNMYEVVAVDNYNQRILSEE